LDPVAERVGMQAEIFAARAGLRRASGLIEHPAREKLELFSVRGVDDGAIDG